MPAKADLLGVITRCGAESESQCTRISAALTPGHDRGAASRCRSRYSKGAGAARPPARHDNADIRQAAADSEGEVRHMTYRIKRGPPANYPIQVSPLQSFFTGETAHDNDAALNESLRECSGAGQCLSRGFP